MNMYNVTNVYYYDYYISIHVDVHNEACLINTKSRKA